MNKEEPEIYFHVGLGKVASTYLQKKVFPYLEGIRYIPSSQYRKSKLIINRSEEKKFLVSREFDKQYKDEINWFLESFSNVKIIVFFRRHDSWITSQYKRFLKNGWYKSFDEFFDLEDSKSYWKNNDLDFFEKIQFAKEKTGTTPLVIVHDQLLNEPLSVVQRIADFTQTNYRKGDISTSPVHTSYSEKQLRFLMIFTKGVFRTFPRDHNENKWKHWLLFRPWWLLYHLLLYLGALMPSGWISKKPLIPDDTLQMINTYYQADWEKVLAASKNS